MTNSTSQTLRLRSASLEQKHRSDTFWHRLSVADPTASARLSTDLGLDDLVISALLAEETRPRCTPHGEGALINLRGVNSQHGAAPEDMVSVRLWLDHEKVVSFQFRELAAIGLMAEWIEGGGGPEAPGDFVVALADRLTEGMESVVDALDTDLDDLEEDQSQDKVHELRETIATMRRAIVRLRRFIAPQRDALDVLIAEPFDWQTDVQERRLKEIVDRITRLVEQLDTMHHRAAILQDFIAVRVAERLNSTMVLLSIVAGVFLPLSFVTGLLGMNVAGIPMATSQSAFLVISGALVVIGVVTFLALWKLRSR